ncbi:YhjD/YihY/BrkB family envelope integrity protein [Leucobacter sp. 1207-22]|uniref:YhjD/YihY/BrkB family envelope integrity protein n=1 Tax=Leucobacter sp. 1207-22 TaxID=2604456 RepID=UPI004062D4A4
MTTDPTNLRPVLAEIGGVSSSRQERVRGVQALWAWVQHTRPFRAWSHFVDIGGVVMASGMSYQALFAVFSALWVGFGIFGIFLRGQTELIETIVAQINTFIPGLVGEENAAVSLKSLTTNRIIDWTSLAAGASLLWISINWFTGTRRSVRIIFGLEVKRYRNAAILKLRDFGLAFLLLLAVVLSAALTILSSNVMHWLLGLFSEPHFTWLLTWLGTVIRYALLFLVDMLVLVAIHRMLAEIRVPWRPLLFGCGLGGAALLVLKILGGVLLGGATSNPLLASFAVFIGLLLWFNLICRVILLTSSWIATGLHPSYGLPMQWVHSPTEETSSITHVSPANQVLAAENRSPGGYRFGQAAALAFAAVSGDSVVDDSLEPTDHTLEVRAGISGRVNEWAVPDRAFIGSGDLLVTVSGKSGARITEEASDTPQNPFAGYVAEEAIRAPGTGYVSFTMRAGEKVQAGDLLARIEPKRPQSSWKQRLRQTDRKSTAE